MKKISQILSLLFVLFLFYSCGENAPTELISDIPEGDESYDLELLSPEPDQFYYANGYDSTGITSIQSNIVSLIGVTRIKDQKQNASVYRNIGTAIFFDTSRVVNLPNGKFFGYRTRILGRVLFNGDSSHILPYKRKFLAGGIPRDTTLGLFHLISGRGNSGGGNSGSLNGRVRINVENQFSNLAEYYIDVPRDINGSVSIVGSRIQNNLALELRWDPPNANSGKIDLVIGGIERPNLALFPLYRIRTRDDGYFKIPVDLLRGIPFDRFDDIVISFIRKNQNASNHNILGFTHIVGQNIHNIRIKIN
jgi:hypothetical protein